MFAPLYAPPFTRANGSRRAWQRTGRCEFYSGKYQGRKGCRQPSYLRDDLSVVLCLLLISYFLYLPLLGRCRSSSYCVTPALYPLLPLRKTTLEVDMTANKASYTTGTKRNEQELRKRNVPATSGINGGIVNQAEVIDDKKVREVYHHAVTEFIE